MKHKQKLHVIIELENQIGIALKEKPYNEIWQYSQAYALSDTDSDDVIGLNLSGCQLRDVSPLQHLTALTRLDLSNNQLTDISPLQNLTALTGLDLSNNQLTDVSPLKGLTALKELYLNNNQLTDVSPLQGLTALTTLRLSANQLIEVSPLQHLLALKELNLSYNQLTDVSPLLYLTTLKKLLLNYNQLTDISCLQNLTALIRLGLSNNQLTDISPILNLTDLTGLALSNNQLTDVLSIQKLKNLEYIYLDSNPLISPPIEIVKQNSDAILNYFKELETASVLFLQCKLLIVGHGEVGKTTLMKKLLNPSFQVIPGSEETTHGIHIESWALNVPFTRSDGTASIETVKLHFWDFGGQSIYHATHQFFLTKRSLYIFVWEARREDEILIFDYWLNIIKLLSANSPVIIVMNKEDVRSKEINEAEFKKKFPNIQAFLKTSCYTNQGIPQLITQIQRTLSYMPHLRDKLPRVWVQIRERLEQEKQNKVDYISLDEYFTLCREYQLDTERAGFLSHYLHDLGIILHFSQDPLLKHTVILNPEWATEAVYKLIDTRKIQENRGSFRFHQLKDIWDPVKYPETKHMELVRLMETFELCFNFMGTDQYFVPELLPTIKDENEIDMTPYQDSEILRFHYHYEFMPAGIVSRFTARIYYLLLDKRFWKNCVELRFEDSTAIVMGNALNRRVTIAVRGKERRGLLDIIRSHFDHIHSTINMKKNEHYQEIIPCICSECLNAEYPYFFNYEGLKKVLHKDIHKIMCMKSYGEVSIDDMLAMVTQPRIASEKELAQHLITTVSQLQGISQTLKADENSRNSFISLLLSNRGYRAKDQTLWGSFESGKNIGELDIKIENEQGRTIAIIEAFNMKGFYRNLIDAHLRRIQTYSDIQEMPELFLIIYSETINFNGLWQQYLDYFTHKSAILPPAFPPEEQPTGYPGIKLALTRHQRDDRETKIYHIFVDMLIRVKR